MNGEDQRERDRTYAQARYALLALFLLLTGLGGYAGYMLYPRFDLPRAAGLGLLMLAVGAGVAAFFSPCSFALLLSLLSRRADPGAPQGTRLRRALVFAASMSVGAATFVIGVGLLVALGGQGIAGSVTFTSAAGIALRVVVGTVMAVFGLNLLGVYSIPWGGPVARLGRSLGRRSFIERHPAPGFAAFGFGYLLAGFG